MASKFNFSLDLGADNVVEIQYSPGGVDFPLTGWTLRCQLRRDSSDDVADLELLTPTDFVINGAKFLMLFTATKIASLEGKYTYDVLATNGGATPRRVVEGVVATNPASTR